MRRIRKLLVCVMCVLMLCSFAGCGNNTGTANDNLNDATSGENYDGSGENDIFGGVEYGLVCYNNTSLKTLEKCTEITQLKMGYQSTGTFYPNIDLKL